ncbi:MAG: YbjN domain-containing protein [Clostridia bacterium]|nr:YbjN domain-containing protein [Clostridia bacterium]
MKRTIALLLALLTLTFALNAFAAEGSNPNTLAFTAELDAMGVAYTVHGLTDDGAEKVTLNNTDSAGNEYTFTFFFNGNNEEVTILVWNTIAFKESDFSRVLYAVNDLNSGYKWVKFFVDESDNTVTARQDVIVRDNGTAGSVVKDAMIHMADVMLEGFNVLGVFAK